MTYDEFESRYLGKAVDYDGTAGVQCVDLADQYLKDVFGITGVWVTGARDLYNKFASYPALVKAFERIPNTRELIIKKGDIVVWGGGRWGHVAIGTGKGTLDWFESIEQNTLGRHEPTQKVTHWFSGRTGADGCRPVLGVLRAKEQSPVQGRKAEFLAGRDYVLTSDMKVRSGPGIGHPQKLRSQLTPNGRRCSYPCGLAVLKKGTAVTVTQVRCVGSSEYWGLIPSGWLCLSRGGKTYAKPR